MNPFQEIKLWLKLRKPVNKLLTEVKGMKSGYKTTEFWMSVTAQLLAVAGALGGVLDPKTAAIVVAVLNAIYAILRTVAKAQGDVSSTTVTSVDSVKVVDAGTGQTPAAPLP